MILIFEFYEFTLHQPKRTIAEGIFQPFDSFLFLSIREFNRDSIIVAPEGVSGDYLAPRSPRNPANFGFRNLFVSRATPPRPTISLSLSLSLSLPVSLFLSSPFFLLSSARTRGDALIIRSRRSFHQERRTGRDGTVLGTTFFKSCLLMRRTRGRGTVYQGPSQWRTRRGTLTDSRQPNEIKKRGEKRRENEREKEEILIMPTTMWAP